MTTRNKIMLAALTAIVTISAAVFVGMQNSNNQAYGQQTPVIYPSRERTISVTGTATTSVSPDLVSIQFGVDTQTKTAKEASSANAQMMNAVVSAVENLGITKDEISTADYNISPVYNQTKPDPYTGVINQVLAGYKVSNMLLVKTTKLSLAGDIIDTAVQAGANRVDSVSFSLSPQQQQSIQDDLLNKAVLNAKSRAGKALDPLGQKIIGVKMVNLSEFNVPPPPRVYGAMEAVPAASTPIFTSNQQVTTTVDVTFLIGDQ
jgi:uncharacterized protein YggE